MKKLIANLIWHITVRLRRNVRNLSPETHYGPALSQDAYHRATKAALSTPPWTDRLGDDA